MLDGFVDAEGKGFIPADNKSFLIYLDKELLIGIHAQIVVGDAEPQFFFDVLGSRFRHHVEMARCLAAPRVFLIRRSFSDQRGIPAEVLMGHFVGGLIHLHAIDILDQILMKSVSGRMLKGASRPFSSRVMYCICHSEYCLVPFTFKVAARAALKPTK